MNALASSPQTLLAVCNCAFAHCCLNDIFIIAIIIMTTENRRNEWFAVGAFSTIALVAITSDMVGDLGDQTDELKWSAVSLLIALAVSAVAFFAHALGKLFVGTIIEGFLVRFGFSQTLECRNGSYPFLTRVLEMLQGVAVFGILAGGIMTMMVRHICNQAIMN